MKKYILSLLFVVAGSLYLQAQTVTGVIRGTITDAVTGEPIPYATVHLSPGEKIVLADSVGNFVYKNLPISRYDIKVTFIGYTPSEIKEILISSVKETVLDIKMSESQITLKEAVVRPRISKEMPLNQMALVGAKMLSVEEASRYAGGFDDPARLASSFSGVSTGGSDNGISIHGFSPHLLQWKLEGVEIPTPNHLSDVTSVGCGLISALSSQVISNSDFLSAAFPAEYSNALSGVFDIKMRNGNNQKYETTCQVGTLGLELACEGPLSKKTHSSFLFNYRYSFLGLVNKMGFFDDGAGDMINYQDLNMKFNFPTKHCGVFSIFALGYQDHSWVNVEKPDKWETLFDQEDLDVKQYMGVVGASHKYFFKNAGRLSTTIAVSYLDNKSDDRYCEVDKASGGTYTDPYAYYRQKTTTMTGSTSYIQQFGSRFTFKSGLNFSRYFFDYNMNLAQYIGSPLYPVYNSKDATNLMSAYVANSWVFVKNWTLNFGVTSQMLTLNGHTSVEPRASLQWTIDDKNTLSFGYGLHSRLEKLDVLFVKLNDQLVNTHLDFTKAHHFILSYQHKFNENLQFKAEAFYQYMFDVPVEPGTSYSVLNRNDYYIDRQLINDGKGRNYGIDFSLEQYLIRGYYWMANTSFFKSRYCGGDGVWHNTRYDRGWLVKALAGKEWLIGNNKKNVFNANIKVTCQGGLRYSPVDRAATLADFDNEVQYDEIHAFSEKFDPEVLVDLSLTYKINGRHVAHEFGVKWLNVTGNKNFVEHDYNYKTGAIEPQDMSYSFPNLCYKLYF